MKGVARSDIVKFPTGAVRSSDAENERYDLISPIGLRRLAETYAEGAARHGERNWEQGMPASALINHALRHINHWLAGDTTDHRVVTNLTLFTRNLLRGIEFTASVRNLFNLDYSDPASGENVQDQILQDGRTFWVKGKYRF